MKERVKEIFLNVGIATLLCSLLGSFGAGKVYNDYQKRIERNIRIETSLREDVVLHEKGLAEERAQPHRRRINELEKTTNFIKNSPLYYPFGKLYDLMEKRN